MFIFGPTFSTTPVLSTKRHNDFPIVLIKMWDFGPFQGDSSRGWAAPAACSPAGKQSDEDKGGLFLHKATACVCASDDSVI